MLQTRSTTRADHGREAADDGRGVRLGLSVFAVGLVLMPVGIGLGLPHVAKTGLQPLSVAGLIALVGGLVLLVVGGGSLVRARRGWRRYLVTLPALIVAVVLAKAEPESAGAPSRLLQMVTRGSDAVTPAAAERSVSTAEAM